MTTLTRPAPAVGLVAVGLDPRPCATKPAQWWDLGDPGNVRAVRYCRNVCPLAGACTTPGEDKVRGQIRDGQAYNEAGKRVKICTRCDHPRLRIGPAGNIACGCPPPKNREQLRAERRAEQEAARAAKFAAKQARPPQGIELVDSWVALHCAGLSVKESAQRLGVRHGTLRNALHRARAAGDRRVPHFRAARTQRQVAA